MVNSVQVRVPATTANIGPGFDCLGAALTLYNEFSFTPAPALEIAGTGPIPPVPQIQTVAVADPKNTTATLRARTA